MNKKRFFKKGLSVFGLMVLVFSLSNFSVFANGSKIQREQTQAEIEQRRADYINDLNEKIRRGEVNPWERSNGEEQYFNITGGGNQKTFFFHGIQASGIPGFKFTLYNDETSGEDAEFTVYEMNSNGELVNQITTWYGEAWREVNPGDNESITFSRSDLDDWGATSFAVIVENDGWSWNKKVNIIGRVKAN